MSNAMQCIRRHVVSTRSLALSISLPRPQFSRSISNVAAVARTFEAEQGRFGLNKQRSSIHSCTAVSLQADLFLWGALRAPCSRLRQAFPSMAYPRPFVGDAPSERANALPADSFTLCARQRIPAVEQRRCSTSALVYADTVWRPDGIQRQCIQRQCVATAISARNFHSRSGLNVTPSSNTTCCSLHPLNTRTKSQRTLTTSEQPSGKESQHTTRIMTIPNLICVARIVATPWICVLVVQGQFQTAFFAFVVAGISDGLDGYIARNFDQSLRLEGLWEQKSVLGSYLDPLSDKILVNSLGFACAASGLLSAPLVAVFFLRDALLILGSYRKARSAATASSLSSTLRSDSPLEIKASPLSKLNTVLQISLISTALAASAFPSLALPLGGLALPLSDLITPLSALTATTTVVSGVQYFFNPGYMAGQG